MAEQTAGAWQQAPTQAANPMATHLRIVAILEIVWGSLAAFAGLLVLLMVVIASGLSSGAGAPGFVPPLIASFGLLFVAAIAAIAVLAILGGMRLLKHRRSGRTLSYVAAALSLLSFPLGTAFGVYAFIILTRPETDLLLSDP
jgi:hypothetical protein